MPASEGNYISGALKKAQNLEFLNAFEQGAKHLIGVSKREASHRGLQALRGRKILQRASEKWLKTDFSNAKELAKNITARSRRRPILNPSNSSRQIKRPPSVRLGGRLAHNLSAERAPYGTSRM